jgi:predicted nucleotidyltransferase
MYLNNINKIVENLMINYQPEKIILFGSYNNGTYTENSIS